MKGFNILYIIYHLSSVFLITGRRSSELFDPLYPWLPCTLPSLSAARDGHSFAGLTLCGGQDPGARQTCETMSMDDGQWRLSHNLQQERALSVMWQTPANDLIVMGGSASQAETLTLDGSTYTSFRLPNAK